MSNHLVFMKGAIIQPIFVLNKEKNARRPSNLIPGALDCYIDDIVEESVLLDPSNPVKTTVHRIFVGSGDGGAYCDVGWVLNDDATHCMLCRSIFGMFSYKHHCKACGNVICQGCSSNAAYVFEIQSQGLLRACNLCYFGQVRCAIYLSV